MCIHQPPHHAWEPVIGLLTYTCIEKIISKKRVRKFREQLVRDKDEKWKNLLESEGISIDLNIPLKKGNIKTDSLKEKRE